MSRSPPRGFTLLEIVLALTILGIMMTVAYSALGSITTSKRALDDNRDIRAIANSVLIRLRRELQLAFNQLPLLPPRDDLEKRYPARINLIGEKGSLANGNPGDRITFMALEGGQYVPDGGTHSGVVQVTYRAADNPNATGAGADGVLVREEVPYQRPFEKAWDKAMVFPVTERLVSLEFAYYDEDDETWLDSWGGEGGKDGLPQMVRFTLALRAPSGKVQTYSTIVALRAGGSEE